MSKQLAVVVLVVISVSFAIYNFWDVRPIILNSSEALIANSCFIRASACVHIVILAVPCWFCSLRVCRTSSTL